MPAADGENVSHRDLLDRLERGFKQMQNDFATHTLTTQSIQKAVGEVKSAQDTLIVHVGREEVGVNGERIGTGLTGRIINIESRDNKDKDERQRWQSRIQGALWAFAIILPIIWWLTQPNFDRLFHPANAAAVHAGGTP